MHGTIHDEPLARITDLHLGTGNRLQTMVTIGHKGQIHSPLPTCSEPPVDGRRRGRTTHRPRRIG